MPGMAVLGARHGGPRAGVETAASNHQDPTADWNANVSLSKWSTQTALFKQEKSVKVTIPTATGDTLFEVLPSV